MATGFLVGPALLFIAGHAVRLSLGASGVGPVAGMVAVFPPYHEPGHAAAQDAVRIPLTELLDSSPPAPDDPVPLGMKTAEDGLDFAFGSGQLSLFHYPLRLVGRPPSGLPAVPGVGQEPVEDLPGMRSRPARPRFPAPEDRVRPGRARVPGTVRAGTAGARSTFPNRPDR